MINAVWATVGGGLLTVHYAALITRMSPVAGRNVAETAGLDNGPTR